jgi:2-dehydro-3-deoxyphosphogluconate aldolase / (4S)-4-hydroxy-2-oxoglutarate aldolase
MSLEPKFDGVPLIGILRGCSDEHLPRIIECVQRGGLTHLEITMNSPGAERQIRDAIRHSSAPLRIGAGTVTNLALLDQALAAGATFIVTPFLARDVVAACASRRIPVFPGALSPTEIHEAWELGATMVKIFPAELGGPAFVRALKGPFPQIEFLPTGGVDLDTLPKLLQAGAAGAGIGSPLFRKERLENQDWTWLEQQVRFFVDVYQKHRTTGARTAAQEPGRSLPPLR